MANYNNPEVLIENKKPSQTEKDLYDYIIAFRYNGAEPESINTRLRVYNNLFKIFTSMAKADIPNELTNNFKNNLGVFFVGAGLSVASGYPTWDGLISELFPRLKRFLGFPKRKLLSIKC